MALKVHCMLELRGGLEKTFFCRKSESVSTKLYSNCNGMNQFQLTGLVQSKNKSLRKFKEVYFDVLLETEHICGL